MSEVLWESNSVKVRRAETADNERLCALLKKVHIKSALDVTQERDPDFFALPRMHLGSADVWLAEGPGGAPQGCGTVITRDGWIDGERRTVGYLGDLRIMAGARAALTMPKAYHHALKRAQEQTGAQLFYTVIFDDNTMARRVLVERSARRRRASQPLYKVMTPFCMTSVQFTRSKAKPSARISRARDRDLDPLRDFLARKSRQRLMGDILEEVLDRRLATWPGFSLQSFLLAKNAQGRIIGAVAPYDTHEFKRTRVLGYYGKMKLIQAAFNLGATFGGFTKLPAPGHCFRFHFLSHLEIEDDDPAVLRDLLLAAYAQLKGQDQHFMSAMIPRGSPLQAAFKGFTVNRSAMTLYAVCPPHSELTERDFQTQKPGFEMALS